MSINPVPLTRRSTWNALEEHYQKVRDLHLRTLFAEDSRRGERFTCEAAGIYLDYFEEPHHRRDDPTSLSSG